MATKDNSVRCDQTSFSNDDFKFPEVSPPIGKYTKMYLLGKHEFSNWHILGNLIVITDKEDNKHVFNGWNEKEDREFLTAAQTDEGFISYMTDVIKSIPNPENFVVFLITQLFDLRPSLLEPMLKIAIKEFKATPENIKEIAGEAIKNDKIDALRILVPMTRA